MSYVMTPEEEEALVQKVWKDGKSEIVKQVESAIRFELTTRMNARIRQLMSLELEALLRPEIETRKADLEVKIKALGDHMLKKVDSVLHTNMKDAVGAVVDYQLSQIMSRAVNSVRSNLRAALNDAVGPASNG